MTAPAYVDDLVTVYQADCLDLLRELDDNSVDAVVTDPPYGLEFMGKDWDAPWKSDRRQTWDDNFTPAKDATTPFGKVRHGMGGSYGADARAGAAFQSWCHEWSAECLRVLKPGGHMLAFGGTRTSHRLACAIEDAGFEIRDSIAWLYGSGFPKSLDVSKAIDKAAGAEREVIGVREDFQQKKAAESRRGVDNARSYNERHDPGRGGYTDPSQVGVITAPATAAAQQWAGWGTALKPAHEPIVVARKPLTGAVAQNVLEHGTGALNIDACRIPSDGSHKVAGTVTKRTTVAGDEREGAALGMYGAGASFTPTNHDGGRWPANVTLDESQAAALDQQSGTTTAGAAGAKGSSGFVDGYDGDYDVPYGDTGGASRFFYCPKANSSERPREGEVAHPTVKPVDLMRWLVRLVTPPGGVVLDPFLGSGTTAEACVIEGFRCVGIEREPDYLPLIVQRLTKPIQPDLFAGLGEPSVT